jgi:hypothetical protein
MERDGAVASRNGTSYGKGKEGDVENKNIVRLKHPARVAPFRSLT